MIILSFVDERINSCLELTTGHDDVDVDDRVRDETGDRRAAYVLDGYVVNMVKAACQGQLDGFECFGPFRIMLFNDNRHVVGCDGNDLRIFRASCQVPPF